jgi:[acyl-carrier-protein] S-malonyltransferase
VLAFTFPGQGSQRSGMGHAWVEHPSWEVAAEASEIAGRDLTALLLDAPMEELTRTANAQLATFVMSLVVLDAVERLGLFPAACAGHSLGEYTALVAAGSLSLSDGTRLVMERGDAMQAAADQQPGTMAALIGIADDDAEAACQRAEAEVWVANYNAPGQVVIAGSVAGIATATDRAKELGAKKALPIPVSGAFHTQLMLPARARLRQTLDSVEFHSPEVPVVANVDARIHTDPAEWPGLLSAQLCSPVRWRQSLEALAGRGATVIAELGPGGVLTGMVRRTIPDVKGVAVSVPADLDKLMDTVAGTDEWTASAPAHQGEHLYTSERVIVSPTPGVFEPDVNLAALETTALAEATAAPGSGEGTDPGSILAVGDRVGTVGLTDVRTPFAGILVRWLAVRGERVVEGQPVAWIRTTGSTS